MHNLTKIKIFRILLLLTYPLALIFIYPFVLFKRKCPGGYFFFFDRYVIGGAQRIHLDILAAIPEIQKEVYFTRVSANDKLKAEFFNIANSTNKDIHFWCDNILLRIFTVHYYVFYINRHSSAHVFSANSTFFYDMLPFIKNTITKTELLHNFTHGKNGMEFFGLANHKYLDNRVVYDSFTLSNIKKQYKEYRVPDDYLKKIHFIEPGVAIPAPMPAKTFGMPLKVLYAGRGGVQKRIGLLNAIASDILKNNPGIEFHFAGTMMDELSVFVKNHSVIHGEISGQDEMYRLYQACHVILMTSAYEGFPMLIKEGMANGCVPVVTALEGNKMHLTHLENALLIAHPEDEAGVINKGIALLTRLANNQDELRLLSENCYSYASSTFNKEMFTRKYRAFFGLAG